MASLGILQPLQPEYLSEELFAYNLSIHAYKKIDSVVDGRISFSIS